MYMSVHCGMFKQYLKLNNSNNSNKNNDVSNVITFTIKNLCGNVFSLASSLGGLLLLGVKLKSL